MQINYISSSCPLSSRKSRNDKYEIKGWNLVLNSLLSYVIIYPKICYVKTKDKNILEKCNISSKNTYNFLIINSISLRVEAVRSKMDSYQL